jgi:hypothetical protein
MITAFTLMAGALIAAVSAWAGWLAGRRSGRAAALAPAVPIGVLCSCGHGYGMHEDEQRCHATAVRKLNGLHRVDPCGCHRYDGPEPLPRAWTPAGLPAGPLP